MEIYIAVCYGRHVDEEISAHKTEVGAVEKCIEFMRRYDRYGKAKTPEWVGKSEDVVYYALRFEDESGELPRCHVEKSILFE